MKLVYMGTAEFAVPALEALAPHVVLVVSQPDRPTGRGLKMKPSAVKQAAERLGIPVETPERARDPEFIGRIRDLDADALVVAAYGQILPQALLDATRRGGINLHGSILPRYRGAAPIQRAIESGESWTGVTLMQMDKGMDTGDVIAKELVAIGADETAGELTPRLAQLAADMARTWLPVIVAGEYPRIKQNHSAGTIAPKITREDAELCFERDVEREYDRFRAVTPSPGAFVQTRLGRLKVLRANKLKGADFEPGHVVAVKPELVVGFRGGAFALHEVQPEGRRAMSGPEFANGARIAPGDVLITTKGDH